MIWLGGAGEIVTQTHHFSGITGIVAFTEKLGT
jgi:hypothetical protein